MAWLRRRPRRPRIAIIGLDCAEPTLVFDQYADVMPTVTALRRHGLYGELESVIPAITVPAWSCMLSGRDPGALGIYGFRNRADHRYGALFTANASSIRVPRLWDILTQHRRRSIVLNVPGTYPPSPINGEMVSCFLTPQRESAYTYPPELKHDIERWLDGDAYPFDVAQFRSDDRDRIITDLWSMTQTHFQVARQMAQRSDWDLFALVEIGVDRVHHAFWSYCDPLHRNHVPDHRYQHVIRDYYALIDREIAALIETFDDQTHILIVSDHGAKRMDGAICINEWLLREGYLVLRQPPAAASGVVKFDQLDVDWSRTRAWGEGGYYGRVFLNVAGREPEGVVIPEQADALLTEISARLEALGDENGQAIGTRCFRPHDLYEQVNGIPPDLLVYFGDLHWRSVGTIGWGRVHIHENDTGPDDANHAQHGILIYSDPRHDLGGTQRSGMRLLQVAPTVLAMLGLPIPSDMQAGPIEAVIAPR